MSQSKPLEDGKVYHFNIIYNHEDSPFDATEDNKKSLEYTKTAVSILTTAGYDKSYYHKRDSRPGRNIFSELFRVINESLFTIVILTPGFLKNQWGKYSRQAAFKKLLDKEKDHRLKALCFGLSKEEVPEELCTHVVSHFIDNSEEDELAWRKLIQEMDRPEEPVTHRTVNEAGDNRLHTQTANALIVHPECEQSLSSLTSSSLDMDGDRQRRVPTKYRSELDIQGAALPVSDLARETESLQIDGDSEVSARTTHSAASRTSVERPLSSNSATVTSQAKQRGGAGSSNPGQTKLSGGTGSSNPGPGQTTQRGGTGTDQGDGLLAAKDRELMTKELRAGKPVTLDVNARPPPSRSPPMSMPLDPSPIVSSPVITKMLPPPAHVGQDVTVNEGKHKKGASSINVRTEQSTSLSDDTDLTFDHSSILQTRDEALQAETNVIVDNAFINDTSRNVQAKTKEVVNNETPNDLENTAFETLRLNSLHEETVPKELTDSGYSSTKASPAINAELVQAVSLASEPGSGNEISSRYLSRNNDNDFESGIGSAGASRSSGDIQDLKEFLCSQQDARVNQIPGELQGDPEVIVKENVAKIEASMNSSAIRRENEERDKSITELKRTALYDDNNAKEPSEVRREQEEDSITELKRAAVCDDRAKDTSKMAMGQEETDLKHVVNHVSQRSEMAVGEEETGLKHVVSHVSQRSEPDGEDAEKSSSRENLEPGTVRGEHSTPNNWLLFGLKCVSSAYTRTDSII